MALDLEPLITPPPPSSPPSFGGGHTTEEIAFSLASLAFGAIIILAVIWVGPRHHHRWDGPSTQIVVLTLIITAGAFLITAGYGEQQITPMIGLLGTIAGYMLGNQRARQVDAAVKPLDKLLAPSAEPANSAGPPARPADRKD